MTLAFVPATALLVPAVGVDSTPELDAVRAAAVEALAGLGPVTVVAPAAVTRRVEGSVSASLHPLGLDLTVGSGEPVAWQAAGALWAAAEAGAQVAAAVEVGPGGIALAAQRLAEDLEAGRALVIAADGSAGLGPKAPGYIIEGSEAFDDALAATLAAGDADALADLDLEEAARVACVTGPVWAAAGRAAAGRAWVARLLHRSAPLGVGYLVARWDG